MQLPKVNSKLNANADVFVPMALQAQPVSQKKLRKTLQKRLGKQLVEGPPIPFPVESSEQIDGIDLDDAEERFAPKIREQFHKTRLCKFNAIGRCALGVHCTFAHTATELQESPDLRKTRLCHDFFRGRCAKPDCNFAHDYAELRSTTRIYKSELCRWLDGGNCNAGDSCRYAHSAKELKMHQEAEKLNQPVYGHHVVLWSSPNFDDEDDEEEESPLAAPGALEAALLKSARAAMRRDERHDDERHDEERHDDERRDDDLGWVDQLLGEQSEEDEFGTVSL